MIVFGNLASKRCLKLLNASKPALKSLISLYLSSSTGWKAAWHSMGKLTKTIAGREGEKGGKGGRGLGDESRKEKE